MNVPKPMLAAPMSKGDIGAWQDWALEQKFDGHRLIVQVDGGVVHAWTRPRKHAGSDGKTMASKPLPLHLMDALCLLPTGIYDGELIAGTTSTDVTRTDLAHTLKFVVFDVLHTSGSTMSLTYDERRRILVSLFAGRDQQHVLLADSVNLTSADDVARLVSAIYDQGGEGAILKRRSATYQQGKRSPDFIKIKKLFTAVCRVTGFEPTRGKVLNRGQYAKVTLEVVTPAPQHPTTLGLLTSVKTLDDFELTQFAAQAKALSHVNGGPHPSLGRKLRVEYQDITPEGGLRHPRWDRWENE